MNKYPEHEKMKKVQDESQSIGRFLDWLRGEQGFSIASWVEDEEFEILSPIRKTSEQLLAQYFDIDLRKIEQEKILILSDFKKQTKVIRK